jgi:hypothetical protein
VADATEDLVGPDDDGTPTPDNNEETKPKSTVDDQLNKAIAVLKSRTS